LRDDGNGGNAFAAGEGVRFNGRGQSIGTTKSGLAALRPRKTVLYSRELLTFLEALSFSVTTRPSVPSTTGDAMSVAFDRCNPATRLHQLAGIDAEVKVG
jgi:hypothetical protein